MHWTNGALLLIGIAMSMTIGINAYLLIQLPVIMITGTVGLWLCYVQHQFEGVYWKRRANCHQSDPAFQIVRPITLLSSLRSCSYRLWDEQRGKLIGYRQLQKPGRR